MTKKEEGEKKSSLEFVNGRPNFWVEEGIESDALRSKITYFTLAVLKELRREFQGIPVDVITVGDNWKLLLTGRVEPENEKERGYLEENRDTIFATMWPMEERVYGEMFPEIFSYIWTTALTEMSDTKLIDRFAILDRTSVGFPIFDEEDVKVLSKTPWGRVIMIEGYNCIVYHLNGEYESKYHEVID